MTKSAQHKKPSPKNHLRPTRLPSSVSSPSSPSSLPSATGLNKAARRAAKIKSRISKQSKDKGKQKGKEEDRKGKEGKEAVEVASPAAPAKWSAAERDTLFALVGKLGEEWGRVAAHLPGKSAKQCMQKFRNSQRAAKKGSWSAEEDALLLSWVERHGAGRWTECSRQIGGRCGKQCRERWVNILNPCVKRGDWSPPEQEVIFAHLGAFATSWSSMARVLPGRTENAIKNYFYSSIRRLKANSIAHLLRDIYVRRKFSLGQIAEGNAFVREEVAKLNHLSQRVCRFLLDKRAADDRLKRFLLSVLFGGDLPTESTAAPTSAHSLSPPADKPCFFGQRDQLFVQNNQNAQNNLSNLNQVGKNNNVNQSGQVIKSRTDANSKMQIESEFEEEGGLRLEDPNDFAFSLTAQLRHFDGFEEPPLAALPTQRENAKPLASLFGLENTR